MPSKNKSSFDNPSFIDPNSLGQQAQISQSKIVKQELKKLLDEFIELVNVISKMILKKTKLPPGIGLDDLKSWGVEGLVKAKKKFKPSKNASFKTYAGIRIRGEILDNIRKEWSYRTPGHSYSEFQKRFNDKVCELLDETSASSATDILSYSGMMYILSLDDFNQHSKVERLEDQSNMSEIFEDQETKGELWQHVSSLGHQEEHLIHLFYKHNLTQMQIAKKLNISQSKVCRMHEKILTKLKERIKND